MGHRILGPRPATRQARDVGDAYGATSSEVMAPRDLCFSSASPDYANRHLYGRYGKECSAPPRSLRVWEPQGVVPFQRPPDSDWPAHPRPRLLYKSVTNAFPAPAGSSEYAVNHRNRDAFMCNKTGTFARLKSQLDGHWRGDAM